MQAIAIFTAVIVSIGLLIAAIIFLFSIISYKKEQKKDKQRDAEIDRLLEPDHLQEWYKKEFGAN